jgi:hypothetical protein
VFLESRDTYSNISADIHLQLAHLYFHEYSGNLSNHISQRYVQNLLLLQWREQNIFVFIRHFLSILWFKNRGSECRWRQKNLFARNVYFLHDFLYELYHSFIIQSVVEHRDCEHRTNIPSLTTFRLLPRLSLFSTIKFVFLLWPNVL